MFSCPEMGDRHRTVLKAKVIIQESKMSFHKISVRLGLCLTFGVILSPIVYAQSSPLPDQQEIVFTDSHEGSANDPQSAFNDAVDVEDARVGAILGSVITSIVPVTQKFDLTRDCPQTGEVVGNQAIYRCLIRFQIHVRGTPPQIIRFLDAALSGTFAEGPVKAGAYIIQLPSSFDSYYRMTLLADDPQQSPIALGDLVSRAQAGVTDPVFFIDTLATAIQTASSVMQLAFLNSSAQIYLYVKSSNPAYKALALNTVEAIFESATDATTTKTAIANLAAFGAPAKAFLPAALGRLVPLMPTLQLTDIGYFVFALRNLGPIGPSDSTWKSFISVIAKNAAPYDPATQYGPSDFDDMALSSLGGSAVNSECLDKATFLKLKGLSKSPSPGVAGFAKRELAYYPSSGIGDENYACQ
jgi:hypothetical protein